ncbi:hypothetical protein M885DRAFT_622272 [Pelagophyceae sp. CCMP2097]|nr:hypothetical protein M885DRAFT_622272 [Pelagophyceae sp. CCMP2097]|mmetsp:Transcript_31545/g.106232  ORF Transcript_31545/g.106232 Transcript_31545/m.106232 type:complete len:312 (-) Transcript_31545:250-1185(-)
MRSASAPAGAAFAPEVGAIVWVRSEDGKEKPWPALVSGAKGNNFTVFYLNSEEVDDIGLKERRIFDFVASYAEMTHEAAQIERTPPGWESAGVDACSRVLCKGGARDDVDAVTGASWRPSRKLKALLAMLGLEDSAILRPPTQSATKPQRASASATKPSRPAKEPKRAHPRGGDEDAAPSAGPAAAVAPQRFEADAPQFVKSLFELLEGAAEADALRWSDDGRDVLVVDAPRLESHVCPRLFTDLRTFSQRLEFYGFTIVSKVAAVVTLRHEHFRRNAPELLPRLYLDKGPPPTLSHAPAKKQRRQVSSVS